MLVMSLTSTKPSLVRCYLSIYRSLVDSRLCKKKGTKKLSTPSLVTTGGVFVVLLCGLAMAIVVAILEFCWNSKRNAQQEKVYGDRCLHFKQHFCHHHQGVYYVYDSTILTMNCPCGNCIVWLLLLLILK